MVLSELLSEPGLHLNTLIVVFKIAPPPKKCAVKKLRFKSFTVCNFKMLITLLGFKHMSIITRIKGEAKTAVDTTSFSVLKQSPTSVIYCCRQTTL